MIIVPFIWWMLLAKWKYMILCRTVIGRVAFTSWMSWILWYFSFLQVPKLLLLAPNKIMAYLSSYHTNFEHILHDFTLIGNQRLLSNDLKLDQESYDNLCSQLDMKRIDLTFVIHCPNSFGVAWTHKDGWKLVYSGDTMPCKGLVDIGKLFIM